jgi:hypothetical protein
MPDNHPFNDILVDGVAPAKGNFRSYHSTRLRVRMLSVDEVVAGDLSSVWGIEIGSNRYNRDTSDTTSAHDGISVLVDAVGSRFLRIPDGVAGEIDWQGAYNAGTSYSIGQGVSDDGASYVSRVNSNVGNTPASSPTQWQLIAAKGDPGDKYTLAIGANGRPQVSEVLLRHEFEAEVDFPEDFTASRASADDAADGTAVFSITKNEVEIGTITFDASDIGVFASDDPVTFEVGDIIRVIAPSPRDATLSDVSITLAGDR